MLTFLIYHLSASLPLMPTYPQHKAADSIAIIARHTKDLHIIMAVYIVCARDAIGLSTMMRPTPSFQQYYCAYIKTRVQISAIFNSHFVKIYFIGRQTQMIWHCALFRKIYRTIITGVWRRFGSPAGSKPAINEFAHFNY